VSPADAAGARLGEGGAVADAGVPGGRADERRQSRVTVRIHGEEYQMRGDESPAHMQELAARVDARMREISQANPRLGTSQVAVLAALNTVNELVRLEEQYHRVLGLLEREWERRKAEGGQGPRAAGAGPGAAGR
jgi:cell division protein ZapA